MLLDKEKAFSEFLRVTKPGGYIGDLEMIWQKTPPEELVDKVYDVWEGFRTMTLEEWKEFFEKMGMVDVKTVDFSETIPDMGEAMKKELGLKGMIKMGCKLLFRSDLRKAMNEYGEIFKEYSTTSGMAMWLEEKKAWAHCVSYAFCLTSLHHLKQTTWMPQMPSPSATF